MSMHLVGPQMTTTSYKKRKTKSVTIDNKVAAEFRAYNKQMRRLKLKEKTIDEYIAYIQGKSTHTAKTVKDPMKAGVYTRSSPEVHTNNGVGNGFAKPVMAYSGERKLLGIGTMHKSNMVPIFEQSDAEDIARMRR